MQIRRLDEADLPAFVDDLYLPFAREMAELDDYNALAGEERVRESNVAYRRDQLAKRDTRIWVAETGDETLAGYACASVKESPPVFTRGATLSVAELFVLPGHRGEGVADDLLDRASAWGRERDCERLGLSVDAENERARAFYERRGLELRRLKLDRSL
jgi:GNAT superfamily N-acetyltransferase